MLRVGDGGPRACGDVVALRGQYIAEEERLEALKWDEREFQYRLMESLGAPLRCLEVIRRDFEDRPVMRVAMEWQRDGTQWALALCGATGNGKTTAATWVAHQLLMRRFRPKWVRCAAMVDAPLWGVEAQFMKHQCRTAAVLVLDDIGAGARERDAKPWLGWLDDVLDARWGARLKTVITTNMTQGELASWLGPRLADRLNEGTIFGAGEPSMRQAALPLRMREPGEDG